MGRNELAVIVNRQKKRESLEDQIMDLLEKGYPRLEEMMQHLPPDKYVEAFIKLLNKLPQGKQNVDMQALLAQDKHNRAVTLFTQGNIEDVEDSQEKEAPQQTQKPEAETM